MNQLSSVDLMSVYGGGSFFDKVDDFWDSCRETTQKLTSNISDLSTAASYVPKYGPILGPVGGAINLSSIIYNLVK